MNKRSICNGPPPLNLTTSLYFNDIIIPSKDYPKMPNICTIFNNNPVIITTKPTYILCAIGKIANIYFIL